MKYRAVSKVDSPNDASEIVLAQKMSAFDAELPAVVSIVGVVLSGSLFDAVRFPAEFELAFAGLELTAVDRTPLEEIFDRRFPVRINFDYLRRPAAPETDVLAAEFLE